MGSRDDTKFRDEAATVPDGPHTKEVVIFRPVTIRVLQSDESLCAPNCKMFSVEDAKTSAFWCSLFQTFLSVSKGKATRCEACLCRWR